jgi:alpha-ketoglutarate-dependent taurine dioxygenase
VVRQNVAKDKIKHTRDTNNTIQARTKTARARSIQDNPAKKSEKSAGDINRAAKSTNRPAKGSKNTVGAGNQKGKRLIGVEKAIGLEALLDEDHILEHRPNLWLRDACPCEKCVDPHSGQKSFATTELEFNPKVRSVARADDGSLTVVWAKDPVSGGQDHTSVYPASIQDGYTKYMHRELWTRATFEQEREKCRVSYDDWMAGGREFWDAMAALASKGLIFVHGVPQGDEQAVERLAGRIGALQDTFYGRTWDVVSKPAAENVAYTNKFLGLHQDLLYYPDPPRVQLLHCLANECEGGESLFSDGVRAAAHMKHTRPYAYELLRRHPAAYHYNRNGNAYYAERAVVKGSALRSRPAESVWWSPPFQAPYPIDGAGGMAPWFLAAQQFQSEIEDPANVVEHRLAAGECVVFDNWRVLHGRRQFNPGTGRRWLKGAYVDDRAFRARYEDMPALVAREHGLWKDRQVEAALNRDAIVRSSNEDYKLDPVAARADALIRLLSSKRVSVAKAKGLMADARTMVDNVRAEALGQAGHQSAESAPEVVQEGAKAQVGEQVQDSPGQHVEGQQGDKRPSS